MKSSSQTASALKASVGAHNALKPDAAGLVTGTVVGLASTAPAYSLTAAAGAIAIAVGPQAPAVILLAFVPTVLIALACQQLNRAEPNCGTTFIWAARAFGPSLGWLGGWAMVMTAIIVMASMAQVAGQYAFALFGADALSQNLGLTTAVGVFWIAVMTWLCYLGLELSAKTQCVLLGGELLVLLAFAAIALFRVYGGTGAPHSTRPALNWFNPLAVPGAALANGVLLAVFVFAGWDAALAINEESVDSKRTPGRAALVSTMLLLGTYVLVTVAAQAFAGVGPQGRGLADAGNSQDSLLKVGTSVFRGGLGAKLLILATLSSAVAAMQTTVLVTARTMLSMARLRAMPAVFVRIHPRYMTPTAATVVVGAMSALYFVGLSLVSTDVLTDSVSSVSLMIAFCYALTAFACAWRFRHEHRTSVYSFVRKVVLPLLGGVMLSITLVKSAYDMAAVDYGKTSLAGVGGVFLLGVGPFALGLLVLAVCCLSARGYFSGRTLAEQQLHPIERASTATTGQP